MENGGNRVAEGDADQSDTICQWKGRYAANPQTHDRCSAEGVGLNDWSGGVTMKSSPQDYPTENYGSYTDQRQEAQGLRYGQLGEPMMPAPREKEKACGSEHECPAE